MSLTKRISRKMKTNKNTFNQNIEDPGSKLKSIVGNKNCFKIPEGYFDELSQKIQERYTAETYRKESVSYKTLLRPGFIAIYTLAIIVGLFFIIQPFSYDIKNGTYANANFMESITSEQLLSYTEIDENTLINSLLENEIEENGSIDEILTSSPIGTETGDLTGDDIIQYLENEDISELTLYMDDI